MPKSWTEKLNDSKDLPKVVKLKPEAAEHWHGETMTVPAPIEVDKIMKDVPKGKVTTIDEIRKKIAKKHKSDIGCPLTCGIFAWIAAHAAEEQQEQGSKRITPWWRTLKSDGSLNPKFPGECNLQGKILEDEGFEIEKRGKKYFVKDFQQFLS